jgi:hypothetical protein
MKKYFTRYGFFLFAVLLGSTSLKAQFTYWGQGEGFENVNLGNINSSSTLAPNPAAPDTADQGEIWTLFECYRTSSTPGPCAGFGAGHIRFLKELDGTEPWIATPDLGFGVNQISVGSNTTTTGKVFTLQYTTAQLDDQDFAGVTAANWLTFAKFKVAACGDTTITLNMPTARRIRFLDDTSIVGVGYQVDLDSVLITSTSGTVAVKFSGISANLNNNIVRVSWSDATEINTSSFEVQRSTDGVNFTTIGSLKATNASSYAMFDNSPSAGTNFYRIRSIGNNGSLIYSTIVRINAAYKEQGIAIAPNPVVGKNFNLQLNNLAKGNYAIEVFNNGSQKIFSGSVSHPGGNTVQQIALPATLTRGLYNVHVTDGVTSFTKSIIVE